MFSVGFYHNLATIRRWVLLGEGGMQRSAGAMLMKRCGVIFLLVTGAAVADVETEVHWQHYPVAIEPGESLAQALDRSSPIRQRGLVYHANTQWQLQWRFWWQRAEFGCAIERVRIDLEVQIQLPALVAGSDAAQPDFAGYLSALTEHERGHQQIALAAAEAVDSALRQLPVAKDCQRLEADANALAEQLLQDFREREYDYDRRTHHGQTQGAWIE